MKFFDLTIGDLIVTRRRLTFYFGVNFNDPTCGFVSAGTTLLFLGNTKTIPNWFLFLSDNKEFVFWSDVYIQEGINYSTLVLSK